MTSNTIDRQRRGTLAVAATVVLVVSAGAAGVSLTAVGTASAAPTGITECTTVTEPGAYELRADLSTVGARCLVVEASDVSLDGNGHRVARNVPPEGPENRSEYGEPPALVVGGSAPVTNVSVRNVTVSAGSLYAVSYSEVTTAAVYFDASDSTLTDVTLYGGAGVVPHLQVVGDDNTVSVRAPGFGLFEIEGDRNRLVDSEAAVGDDLFEAINVSGRGNVLENVSSYGDPGLLVADAPGTVVRNGTFTGIHTSGVNVESSSNVRLVNDTVTGSRELVVANSSSAEVRGNALQGLTLEHSDDGEVVDNDVTRHDLAIVDSDGNTVHGNDVNSGFRLAGSGSNLVYDNDLPEYVTLDATGDGMPSNAWNVSPRTGGNVVGGDTVAGNYWNGFSAACADADSNGVCDSPNYLGENNTDSHPLAAEGNASGPYFEVEGVDVPAAADEGRVTATVTNIGSENDTQRVDLWVDVPDEGDDFESRRAATETVTLDPGETTTVTFDTSVDRIDAAQVRVESADSAYTKPVSVEYAGNYQIDFVIGTPIDSLSAANLYAPQNRLLRFAFGNTDAGVVERGSAWPSETVRNCVEYGHITTSDGWDTAEVTLEFVENCPELEMDGTRALFSLVVYSMPGETFDPDTADQQTLLVESVQGVYPETFSDPATLTVDLPDANESAESNDGATDLAVAVRATD